MNLASGYSFFFLSWEACELLTMALAFLSQATSSNSNRLSQPFTSLCRSEALVRGGWTRRGSSTGTARALDAWYFGLF